MRHFIAGLIVAALAGAGAPGASLAAGSDKPAADPAEVISILIPGFAISVFRDGAAYATLSIEITVKVMGEAAMERVKELMPRLRDAYLRDLQNLSYGRRAIEEGIDSALARERFVASSERILGPNVARDVTIRSNRYRRLS